MKLFTDNMKRLFFYRIFKLFPIRKNKILFISHLGKSYGCNPKYICEYLLRFHQKEFDLHWAFDPYNCDIKDIPKQISLVNIYSLKFLFDILTCRVLISNTRIPNWFNFEKRKGQQYIQTWHSSLRLKKIEGDAHLDETYEELAKFDSSKISAIVSGCRFSSNIYRRAFWYDGPILEIGTPRVDYLLQQQNVNRQKLLEKVGLKTNEHYILYAPTFRQSNSLAAYNIDYQRLANNLHLKFGGDWKILCRLHPNLYGKVSFKNLDDLCIDMTTYGDIQELLVVADILITDFSSSMFDMAYLKKPCILYVSDLQEYLQNERELYFNLNELPFPLTEDNDQLSQCLTQFNKQKYLTTVDSFLSKIGNYEKGNASEKIYQFIKRKQ